MHIQTFFLLTLLACLTISTADAARGPVLNRRGPDLVNPVNIRNNPNTTVIDNTVVAPVVSPVVTPVVRPNIINPVTRDAIENDIDN